MFLRLIPHIIHHIPPNTRPMHPIQQSPRRKIALPVTFRVEILPARDSAEDDAGNGGVAGEGHGFFEGCEGEKEEVGEEVSAEDDGGEVGWDEAVEEPACWVVVVGCEGVRGFDWVVVAIVEFA